MKSSVTSYIYLILSQGFAISAKATSTTNLDDTSVFVNVSIYAWKNLTISLIIKESSAKIFWQWLWAKPTENLLIKSCHGPMVRSPQKSTSDVALSTALWPGNRQWINIEHKAGTSQKPFCKSHNPDTLAAALLFHLDVDSRCQKPKTSWGFNRFFWNTFRTFFHLLAPCFIFPLLYLDLLERGMARSAIVFPLEIWGQVRFLRVSYSTACECHKSCHVLLAVTSGVQCCRALSRRVNYLPWQCSEQRVTH